MYFLGIALLREKDYAAARELFEELVREHENWGPGHGMLGQALYLQGLRREADSSFREVTSD